MLRHSEAGVLDFRELDALLRSVDPLLRALAANHRLTPGDIERWRWDEPTIVLTWEDPVHQGIGKNIAVSIADGEPTGVLRVEVNAWLDRTERNGTGMVRRWEHAEIDALRATLSTDDQPWNEALVATLQCAYQRVAAWSADSLHRTQRLGEI